jgi:hypothetical protein
VDCVWPTGGGDVGRRAQDEGAQCEVVKDFAAVAPDVGGAVFADAFVVEAVDRRDLAGFVVAADEGDAIRVADFEAKEEKEGFEGVEAPVHEIAHEEVVGVGYVAANSEQLHQVVKLSVYVTAYCDRCIDCDDVAFFY